MNYLKFFFNVVNCELLFYILFGCVYFFLTNVKMPPSIIDLVSSPSDSNSDSPSECFFSNESDSESDSSIDESYGQKQRRIRQRAFKDQVRSFLQFVI